MGVDAHQLSKSHPRRSHSRVPPTENNRVVDEVENPSQLHVGTLALSEPDLLHIHSTAPQIPLESKRQKWDYLSRPDLYELLQGLEVQLTSAGEKLVEVNATKNALAAHFVSVADGLEDCRKRVKNLENSDLFTAMTEDLKTSRDSLVKAQSDLQQAETRRLEGELELFELRKKVEVLERTQASNDAQRMRDETQPPNQFGGLPLSEGLSAQDQAYGGEVSDRQRCSTPGAQANVQGGNRNSIAVLGGVLANRTRMYMEERTRRQELETALTLLKSELGECPFSRRLSISQLH
jgi:hypothetical protein